MRKLIDLFEAPATQGVTGSKLAQTSGGQFMNRADRTNQAKVDAALGPGFKAGSAAANLALAKKFSQPQPAGPQAQAPTISDRAATDTNVAGVTKPATQAAAPVPADQSLSPGEEIVDNPSTNTEPYGGAAANAMASSSSPTPMPSEMSGAATADTSTQPAAEPAQAAPAPAPVAQAAPKSDYQPVTGGFGQKTNIVSRTADKIAADNKAGIAGQNPATKSYASIGDFASAVGDKVKGMFGGNKPAAAPAAQTSAVPEPPALEPQPIDTSAASKPAGGYGRFTEELEEELEEMMRLSGLPVNEKAVSQQQQKFMGMVHAMQKGEKIKGASPELKKVAKTMSKKSAHDFAATKHKGLPKKVTEDVMLDEGGNALKHITNRFKHEVKSFMNTGNMADALYDALYDYYLDTGEMPYGIAKAREGDPYQWVEERFYADMGSGMSETAPQHDTLSELARLAGLHESRVDECGDMGMDHQDSFNVSTNMSSDGTKNVTISAQGDKADELLSMLKLAGMGHSHHHHDHNEPEVIMVSDDDEEMMDEERETQYANTPDEEYETIAAITRQGNDLNREKRQYADKPKLGDNPMAESILDEELSTLLDSILIKELDQLNKRPKGDTGQAEIWTADLGIPPPSPDEGPVGKQTTQPKVSKPAATKPQKWINPEPDDAILNLPPKQRGVK